MLIKLMALILRINTDQAIEVQHLTGAYKKQLLARVICLLYRIMPMLEPYLITNKMDLIFLIQKKFKIISIKME